MNLEVQQGDTINCDITITNKGGYSLEYSMYLIDVFEENPNLMKRTSKNHVHQAFSSMKSKYNELLNVGKITQTEKVVEILSNNNAQTSFHVAVIGCEHLSDVCNKIDSTNTFASTTLINARLIIPTLEELKA